MNTKLTIHAVLFASLTLNYFALPIAAPVYKESIKQATAERLMALASDLHPTRPTYIPPVQQATLDRADCKQAAMPPKLNLDGLSEQQIAARYPASSNDSIAEILRGVK